MTYIRLMSRTNVPYLGDPVRLDDGQTGRISAFHPDHVDIRIPMADGTSARIVQIGWSDLHRLRRA